ncbi:hypothetical protein Tco_1456998 [Tanacetum coccineum]
MLMTIHGLLFSYCCVISVERDRSGNELLGSSDTTVLSCPRLPWKVSFVGGGAGLDCLTGYLWWLWAFLGAALLPDCMLAL